MWNHNEMASKSTVIRIASFDIGKKNFAQYIEDVDGEILKKLSDKYCALPATLKRKVKGPISKELEKILHSVCISGTRVQTGVYDLRDNSNSDTLDLQTRKNILTHLYKYQSLWDDCDMFIIEQQYFKTWSGRSKKNRGTEANVDAIKIAESVFMWFLDNYPFKTVMYFGSQNKTQILGAPWKMTKSQRKKWAEEKAREIYELRGDQSMIELFSLSDRIFRKRLDSEKKIQSYIDTYPEECSDDCRELAEKVVRHRQKLDDISDACIQAQAFKFRCLVAGF